MLPGPISSSARSIRPSRPNARSARLTIKRFGDATPPSGPILAVSVEDLVEKEAVLASNPKAFFTIPHFDGYAAILVRLDKVTKKALKDALVDGWLAVAPERLIDQYFGAPDDPR